MKAEEFNKLPKAVQRVKVAQDVIKQVKHEVYKAEAGCWVDLKLKVEPKIGEQIQKSLTPSNIENCHVCGLGALMISAVRLKNSLRMPNYSNYSDCEITLMSAIDAHPETEGFGTILRRIFSKSQIELIEIAFEKGLGYYTSGAYASTVKKAAARKATKFGADLNDVNELLIAIMQNIVENKGTFKP